MSETPPFVDASVPLTEVQRVLEVAIADRDGSPLPFAAGAVIEDSLNPDSLVVLLPTQMLLGAAHCTVVDQRGRPRALKHVVWRTSDGVLAALSLPEQLRKGKPWTVAPASNGPVGHGWNLGTGNRPLTPIHIQQARWSSHFMCEVGEITSGGWTGLYLNEQHELSGFVLPSPEEPPGGNVVGVDQDQLDGVDAVAMTVAQFVDMTFGDDPNLLLRQARKHLAAKRYSQAVFTFHRALDEDRDLLQEIASDLLLSHKGTLASSSARTLFRVRLDLLEGALRDFPGNVDLLIDQSKTAHAGAEFELAWTSWRKAHSVEPETVGSLSAIASDLYHDWATWLERSARLDECLAVLREGIVESELDLSIVTMLARLLMKERAYVEAAGVLREALFAKPNLEETLGTMLARAERMQDRPGNVIIDYPPGAKSIHATVALNGVSGEFIVDTGASTTMVPDDLARRAGLDTGSSVPRVRIRTAGNERVLPFSPVESLSVGALSVTGLSVVVGDLSGLGNLGLLGMDFLGQFGFENDSINGRFVIFSR